MSRGWERVIGIVGGLGPHSHIRFEQELLRAAGGARGDQDYPDWVVVSRPGTPDRTAALLEGGESPLPHLVAAVDSLCGRADFAVIVCNTAHAWLSELRSRVALPVLDVVGETLRAAARAGHRRVGLLATTGTLKSAVYAQAAAGLEVVSLLDLENGERLQRELMETVYGRLQDGRLVGGLKTGATRDPVSGAPYRGVLLAAARELAAAGAEAIVLGCTELPLALDRDAADNVCCIDPLEVSARAALEIAAGRREV